MTDLEITKLCAQAMGFTAETNWGPICQIRVDHGVGIHLRFGNTTSSYFTQDYNPLHDDAQAMALVKKFCIEIHCRTDRNGWYAGLVESDGMTPNVDLNRAICECVAKMQEKRSNDIGER